MRSVVNGATSSNGVLIMSRRIFATCSVAGKGSVSKTIEISYTKSRGIKAAKGIIAAKIRRIFVTSQHFHALY